MTDTLTLKEVAESFLIDGAHPNLLMVAEAALRADEAEARADALVDGLKAIQRVAGELIMTQETDPE